MSVFVRVELWNAGETGGFAQAEYFIELGVTPPGPGLADPLTISNTMSPSDFWPAQPDPATCQFALVLPELPATLPCQVGDQVAVEIRDAPGVFPPVPVEGFYGRVGAVTITPEQLDTETRGVRVQYTCVDYTAELAEEVPTDPFTEESQPDRAEQIMFGSATSGHYDIRWEPWTGVNDGAGNYPPNVPTWFPAADGSTKSIAQLIEEHLFVTVALPDPAVSPALDADEPGPLATTPWYLGPFRYVLAARIFNRLIRVSGLNPTQLEFSAWPRTLKTPSTPLTLYRDPNTGVLVLVGDLAGTETVIDGCWVDRDTEWTRVKGDNIGQVAFQLDPVPAGSMGAYTHGVVNRVYPQEATPAGVAAARAGGLLFTIAPGKGGGSELSAYLARMGELYLGGTVIPDWGSGDMVWHRSGDPDGMAARLPPVGSSVLVAVADIADEWTPNPGRTWVAGELVKNVTTVSGGAVTTTIQLRESPTPAGSPEQVTWAELAGLTAPPTFPAGPRWQDVDPADRWFEYGYATV